MPLDDLLASLPPELLELQGRGTPLEDGGGGEAEEEVGEEGGAVEQVESCQLR